MRLGKRCGDSAQIGAIQEVSVAILTQGDHQLRGRGAGHIHNYRPGTADVEIAIVQRQPIFDS